MRYVVAFAVAAILMMGSPWVSDAYALCGICKSKCESGCEAKTTAAPCNACEAKPAECCTKVKVCEQEMNTKYKWVSECVPVCKTRYEKVCDPCDPCKTKKVAVQYTDMKTKWKLVSYCEPDFDTKCKWVKECVPVCKTRYEKVCDPCDPCKTKKVAVQYTEMKTKWRLTTERVPDMHTRTIKVCSAPTPCNGAVSLKDVPANAVVSAQPRS